MRSIGLADESSGSLKAGLSGVCFPIRGANHMERFNRLPCCQPSGFISKPERRWGRHRLNRPRGLLLSALCASPLRFHQQTGMPVRPEHRLNRPEGCCCQPCAPVCYGFISKPERRWGPEHCPGLPCQPLSALRPALSAAGPAPGLHMHFSVCLHQIHGFFEKNLFKAGHSCYNTTVAQLW